MTSDLHLDAVRGVESGYYNGGLAGAEAASKLRRLGFDAVDIGEILSEIDGMIEYDKRIKAGMPEP